MAAFPSTRKSGARLPVLSNEALKTVSVGPAKAYGLHAARCVAPASECVPPGHGAHDEPPDEYESAAQSATATRTTQLHAARSASRWGAIVTASQLPATAFLARRLSCRVVL